MKHNSTMGVNEVTKMITINLKEVKHFIRINAHKIMT